MRSPRTSSTKRSTSWKKRNIQIREDETWLSSTWISRIWSEEIQNTHWLGAWISKTTLIGSQTEQAQRERIHSCSELVMKDHLHQESCARSCPEIERMSKVAAMLSRGNYWKNNEDWKNFLRSMIRNHEQCVYSSTILTHRAVLALPTFRTKLLLRRVQESSAAKLECREITRESMSIPGKKFFDRQHARRSPDELHNDSRNLTTPSGIADDVEDSEKRSNWE